jgi:hypothetical protein
VPNEMKAELVKNLQGERGCFWMDKSLVVWDGPSNKGVMMLSKSSVAPFELDSGLEGVKLVRFTTRRMKNQFVRQCSRRLSKAVCLKDGFIELPDSVFDAEKPDLSRVEDEEVREWLMML